jgi:Asp-tRNA(Asn)/Glu-tRNA(Gln) amidotransferase A subunit family amidase
MNLSGYAQFYGLGLTQLLQDGEVNPRELQDCALDAVSQLNPLLNVLSGKVERNPNWQEGKPFSGVPFLVKEGDGFNGFPLLHGSRRRSGFVTPKDSVFAERGQNTGVAILALTTAPK